MFNILTLFATQDPSVHGRWKLHTLPERLSSREERETLPRSKHACPDNNENPATRDAGQPVSKFWRDRPSTNRGKLDWPEFPSEIGRVSISRRLTKRQWINVKPRKPRARCTLDWLCLHVPRTRVDGNVDHPTVLGASCGAALFHEFWKYQKTPRMNFDRSSCRYEYRRNDERERREWQEGWRRKGRRGN